MLFRFYRRCMIDDELRRWVRQQAVPIPHDASAVPDVVGARDGQARIVGLGAAVRHAADSIAAGLTVIQDLVTHHGFRALVLEGTDPPFTTAASLDRFVTTGEGDPRALLAASQGFARTRETLALVLALRSHSATHPDDPVRIVHGGPDGAGGGDLADLERELADRSLAWHDATGQRIVHWGGSAHVIAGDPRELSPGGADLTHRNAGGHLRAALGEDYLAVAATVGTVASSPGTPAVPDVPDEFTESALQAGPAVSWIPLRDAATTPASRTWLRRALRTRSAGPTYDPDHDRDHYVSAPTVAGAVDAFLHVRASAAATPL